MATARFLRQLDGLQYCQQALQDRASSSPQRKPGNKKITKSDIIRNAAEEPTAAEEELRQQYEELLAAHQALLEERYRYQQLFDDAPDGYLVTDTDGVIQEANRAASVLLHRRQQHLVGKPLAVLVAPPERQRFYQMLTDLEAGQDVGEQDIGFQLVDGTRLDVVLAVNTVRGPWEQARGFRWMLRGSTERTQAQQR